jgi:hypothetical protein
MLSPRDAGDGGVAGRHDVIFEFVRIGGSVKVTAVDAATGVEVSIVGTTAASDTALKRVARRKLDYVIAKRGARGADE